MTKNATLTVGINRTQDASLALIGPEQNLIALAKERITKKKHHWGALGDIDLYRNAIPALRENPVGVLVECYSSDKEILKAPEYLARFRQSLSLSDDFQHHLISHHLAHVYSAFPPSPFTEANVLVVDFQGSHVRDLTETYNSGSPDAVEVLSYYHCEKGKVECLHKQVWDGKIGPAAGLGVFYNRLAKTIFQNDGDEGKVMGLAAFGDAAQIQLPNLQVKDGCILIPEEWLAIFGEERYKFNSLACSFPEKAALAARGQEVFEEALLEVVGQLRQSSASPNLCIAGGIGLNILANSHLLNRSGFDQVFVPPAPHDGGTAIGCALYGQLEVLGNKSTFGWSNDYLGPPQAIVPDPDQFTADGLDCSQLPQLTEAVADIIAQGELVAVFQPRSEFGPRALGNRSIIGNPCYDITRFYINAIVKGREWFRPLAPMLKAGEEEKYFEQGIYSPHMLYSFTLRPEFRNDLKAIVNHDHTARIQSVNQKENPFIFDLLEKVEARTGYGILLNTSFNLKENTIVETWEDAVSEFQKMSINYLVAPPFLISKQDKTIPPYQVKSLIDTV